MIEGDLLLIIGFGAVSFGASLILSGVVLNLITKEPQFCFGPLLSEPRKYGYP